MNHDLGNCEFIADAIIAYIRAGNRPTDAASCTLDKQPIIDLIRKRIAKADLDWLAEMIRSDNDSQAGLGCSLARSLVNEASIKSCLQERWGNARPYLKNRLMWSLLQVNDLPPSWRDDFVTFIEQEPRAFHDFNEVFFGKPPEMALQRIDERISNPEILESKKWIYLCCIPGFCAPTEAMAIIQNAAGRIRDPFATIVVQRLLKGSSRAIRPEESQAFAP